MAYVNTPQHGTQLHRVSQWAANNAVPEEQCVGMALCSTVVPQAFLGFKLTAFQLQGQLTNCPSVRIIVQ